MSAPAVASGPAAGSEGRGRVWPWALTFLAIWGVQLTAASGEIGGNLGGDSVVYFLLGKALATGQGYVDLYLPGHPAHTRYPFLFPLLLAPFHLLFERPLLAMHAMVAGFGAAAAVWLGMWAGERRRSRGVGVVFALIFGTIPVVYLQGLHLLTEPVYMAGCGLGLWALGRSADKEMGRARLGLVALAVLGAYFTRSAGLALAVAAVAALGLNRARTRVRGRLAPAWLLLLILFAFAAGAWGLRNLIAGGETSDYFGQFWSADPSAPERGVAGAGDLAARFAVNLKFYAPILAGNATSVAWRFASGWLGVIMLVPLLVGLVRGLRGPEPGAGIFFLVSVAIALVWPYRDDRFILPLIPLSVYFILGGLEWPLALALGRARAAKALPALLALCLALQVLFLPGLIRERFARRTRPSAPVMVKGHGEWSRPVIDFAKYDMEVSMPNSTVELDQRVYTEYLIINAVARELTPPGSIIVSRKPMWTYYLSGRESVSVLGDPDPARQWEFFRRHHAAYIVVGHDERGSLPAINRALAAHDGSMEIVAQIQGGWAALIKIDPARGP